MRSWIGVPGRKQIVEWLDSRLYPSYSRNWDDAMFRLEILEQLESSPGARVLDLGAGAGVIPAMDFRPHAGEIWGVDPDPRVKTNPYLHEARIGTGEAIPCNDEFFDVVITNNVMEHLQKPGPVFTEVSRVLRPGGVLLLKTPNRFHYVPLVARLTPHRFHEWLNERRGRTRVDTFPTYYPGSCTR